MRKLLGLGTAVAVAFALASTASARPLNWSGTLTLGLGELPPSVITGGGVATVNGSAGPIPAHLGNLRLAASRGQVTGTGTALVTDPDTYVGINAVVVEAKPRTGTIGPISGAIASTMALTMGVMPIGGLARVCLLDLSCTPPNVIFIPLTSPTAMAPGVKGVGVGGVI